MRRVKFGRLGRLPAAAILATIGIATASLLLADRQIVVNTSPSMPPGLYRRSALLPTIGCSVDFPVPLAAVPYIRRRTGRDGQGWFLLKPIAAGPGDRVNTLGSSVLINGRPVAPMPPVADGDGIPLPVWREDRTLAADEYFALSTRIPNSFDSRCFGPITGRQIAAVRVPVITW